jgi:hypothetical protein
VRELAQALQIAVHHLAVPLDDVAAHDDRVDVTGMRAEDNCAYRIRNRRKVNVGRADQDDIGLLTGGQRSDPILKSIRFCAGDGGELKNLSER